MGSGMSVVFRWRYVFGWAARLRLRRRSRLARLVGRLRVGRWIGILRVVEPHDLADIVEPESTGRPVALFADDDLRHPGAPGVPVILLGPPHEQDQIRILLDVPGLAEVAHVRPRWVAIVDFSVELRE